MLKGMARQKTPIVFKSGEPISVICVASTFTSLSYANNGGKVQITSSGVHGLTTSPAVGAKVYVSWSGGTGVSGLYTVLSVDSTTAITIDLVYVAWLGAPSVIRVNTVFIIGSIFLPALTVSSKISAEFNSDVTGSTNNKVVSFYLNSSEAISSNVNVAATKQNNFRGVISNIGATNVQTCTYYGATTSSHRVINEQTATPTATLKLNAMFGAANEIISITHYIVEVFI